MRNRSGHLAPQKDLPPIALCILICYTVNRAEVNSFMRLLASTKNTRAILPGSVRFVRSDVPDRITQPEIQWLIEHQIVTVIDLRQDDERRRRSCPLIDQPQFRYLCMPVTGGDAVPPTPDDVSTSYIRMVDSQMGRIIETIMASKTNVLFFCNAGKDRTGVVAALLLNRLGMDRAYIIADYLESAANLRETIDLYTKQFPNVSKEVITPHARYMEEFLDWLDAQPQTP